jgi:hypothetical protein
VTFNLSAVDESNNWQNAIWRVSIKGEEEVRKDMCFTRLSIYILLQSEFGAESFSLGTGPQQYNFTICAQSSGNCTPSGEIKELRFSLIESISGSVVSIAGTAINPPNSIPMMANVPPSKCACHSNVPNEASRDPWLEATHNSIFFFFLPG